MTCRWPAASKTKLRGAAGLAFLRGCQARISSRLRDSGENCFIKSNGLRECLDFGSATDYTRVMNPMHASPNLKRSSRLFFLAAAMVIFALIDARSAGAATYNVNLSFSGGGTASLVGTVDLPLGNYTIMNGAPHPFTAGNLTLTVNGTPYSLVQADTSLISGTGQFLINANASTLIFDTANANSSNPADLIFRTASTNDRYIIGSNGDPHFEAAYTSAGDVLNGN